MAKYKIIPSSRTIVQSPISIGHKAEKGVEAIEFDLTAWVETYGSGTLTVIMRRWGDAIPYPIALEIDENNKATWTLSDIDTAKAGMAYAQLSYVVGDEVVKKSDIYTFRVMDSLTGEGEPPEAYESWLEHLTHFAAEAMAEVLDIEGIVTDKTLTVDGGIADAKATGDALSALEDQFGKETDKLKADLSATKMQTALYNAMNLVAFRPVKSTQYQGNTTNNGITYEWNDDNTCTVSGTASSMSFNNIYSDTAHFPSWLKKGETYVFKGGTNVSLDFYVYKNGTYYYGLSVKNTEKEYTIPEDVDGLIMRLQVANGATVSEIVSPICRKKDVPSNGELYDLLYTPVTIEDLGWTYGGLDSAGNGNNSDKRVRYKTKAGRGAFWVPQGTKISAASGYKFNVALYSDYQEEGNFTLIGYRGLRVGTYTVPKDCYIRVAVGTTADDILWTMTDNVKSFTAAGIAAQSALTITGLTPIPLNERVETLENQLSGGIITPWESAIELKDEIPLNALDFHALFDELVSNGRITRTLLANIGNDSRYPVYLYTLRNDMNHIATDYSRVIWDGSNELYQRPKIWLTGGIHGNERTMPFVIYSFIEKLANNVYYQDMLNAFDWYFVPLVNPWGFSHSARDKTTGDWIGGGAYTAETKDDYDVYENTVEHHQGIRSVESGLDANRDFTTFATQEAQLIRDALISLTADGRNFAFAIDAHLSTGGDPSAINALGAFMSPGGDASQSVKEFLFSKWMQAGAKSESIMADYCGVNNVQTVFAWDGTSDARIMRNYLQGYTDNAMCFEGGQTCVYYSGTTNWSNDVARTFCNTQYHLFLKKLTEYWVDLDDLDERVTDIEAGGGGGSGGSSTLAGLTDTSISNKVDGQVLTYDNTSHKWINKTPAVAENSLIVTVSGTGLYRTCDKTYTEIYNAISTGKTVVAVDGTGVVYPYAGLMEQNGTIAIALGISVVYNKTATLTGYLIVEMSGSTVAVRQDQSSSFYDTSETYTKNQVNEYVYGIVGNYYTRSQIDGKIGDIETLLAAI